VVDKVFELVGDYDNNGSTFTDVGGTDFFVWQSQTGSGTAGVTLEMFSADGDDDGDVDNADLDVWNEHYGHVFGLLNVTT
jgi:hypothetical protein